MKLLCFIAGITVSILVGTDAWSQPYYTPRQVMVEVTNQFGVCILKRVSTRADNVAFSPYGLVSVGLVLYEGARGPTAAEIHNALGLPWDREVTRIGFRDLHRHLKSYFTNDGFLRGLILSKPDVKIKSRFLKLLRYYGFYSNTDNESMTVQPDASDAAAAGRTEEPRTTTSVTSVENGKGTNNTGEVTTPSESFGGASQETTTLKVIQESTPLPVLPQETTTLRSPQPTSKNPLETTLRTPEGTTNFAIPQETTTSKAPEEKTTMRLSQEETTLKVPQEETTVGVPAEETTLRGPQETTTSPQESTSGWTSQEVETTSFSFPQDTPELTPQEITITTEATPISEMLFPSESPSTPTMDPPMTPYEVSVVKTTVNSSITAFDPNTITGTPDPVNTATGKSDKVGTDMTEAPEVFGEGEPANPTNNQLITSRPNNEEESETSVPVRMPRSLVSEGSERGGIGVPSWILDSQGPQWVYTIPSEQWFFTYNGGETVPVLTYTAYLPFAYISGIKSLALQLPLDDPRYYMLILLPEDRFGLENLLESLSQYSLTAITDMLKTIAIYAVVPSFSTVKHINLGPPFAQLGVRSLFDPFRADLSEMSLEKHVFVRTIEQVVTISVRKYYHNHRWFDASPNDIQQHFIANHPFAYFVLDKETNVALMAGTVINPLMRKQ